MRLLADVAMVCEKHLRCSMIAERQYESQLQARGPMLDGICRCTTALLLKQVKEVAAAIQDRLQSVISYVNDEIHLIGKWGSWGRMES